MQCNLIENFAILHRRKHGYITYSTWVDGDNKAIYASES